MSCTKYLFCPLTGSRDFKHYHKRFHESFYLWSMDIVAAAPPPPPTRYHCVKPLLRCVFTVEQQVNTFSYSKEGKAKSKAERKKRHHAALKNCNIFVESFLHHRYLKLLHSLKIHSFPSYLHNGGIDSALMFRRLVVSQSYALRMHFLSSTSLFRVFFSFFTIRIVARTRPQER